MGSLIEQTLQQAVTAQRTGDLAGAIRLYEKLLTLNPNHVDGLTLLGPLRYAAGDQTGAIELLQRATILDPAYSLAWYNLGLALVISDPRGAQAALLKAVNLEPQQQPFWRALAQQLLSNGNAEAAAKIYADLNQAAPTPEQLILQGEAMAPRDVPAARALALHAAEFAHATHDQPTLSHALVDLNRYDHLLNAPKAQLDGAYLHLLLSNNEALPWVQLARIYLAHSQYQLALAMLEQAAKLDDRSLEIRWLQTFAHALPIYGSQRQITEFLAAYEQALSGLRVHLDTLSDAELTGAELLPDLLQPLFLAYNGEDILRAQSLAGDIMHALMTRRLGIHPLLTPAQRIERQTFEQDDRIRLAIVSETFYYHSNMKLRRSWLRRIDRNRFKLCLYHTGRQADAYTNDIRAMADEFHHIADDFTGLLAKLRADAPDIIQYTNIGLNTLTIKLAALRLAPVQVTTWGHPITSGLPTIDYFLSSELMEPPEAQAYYREKLVRMPGLSVVPEEIFSNATHFQDLVSRSRADYGFAVTDILYLCLQSVQKYLPRHDDIYAQIAAKVPHARFIFIEHAENAAIMDLFKLRLRGPFHAHGLDPDRYLVFLPFQDQTGYSNLHRLADVTLDSLEWSGANTTFEALELGGLLLTCPGRFMRGRHTAAILNYLGMPELIACDESHYIEMAIAWGLDGNLRDQLRAKLAAAKPNLYRDPGLGDALNQFYSDAFRNAAH